MPQIITARRLLTDAGFVDYPVITVDDNGLIAAIDVDRAQSSSDDTLTPSLFDVHTHGGVGKDVMTATPADFSELQRFYASHGVAHYLPTTVTDSIDTTLHALERIADNIERPTPANESKPVAIHLEGPFLSHAKRGVHPAHDLLPPTIKLFDRFQQAARGHIALVTVAPELPGAVEFIEYTRASGIRVSLGHTNATLAEAQAAIDAGAASATHTFNAMRPLDHREPGVVAAVLNSPELFAELIADGIHVHPEMMKLWWRSKGAKRALLVTDSMSATGMADGDYTLGGLAVTVENQTATLTDSRSTLAGSLLTLDRAVENLQHFIGVPLAEAVRAASTNPAAMLGRNNVVSVSIGAPAHLNRYNAEGRRIATYLHGHELTS
ncbi:N-acetylglucosamine-6-phosphate deacetylase [Granulicella cerasi]|uniref:N-acetylglucosamine-6-phosphate deacetylase n=1 Tax=Granulicella cerasi TaxID=741063 RepID=A0ABW1ZF76_9BACT|nr:N-acetylglucosamine-6-phosphate deacetylase [Granulicella cerasi]